MSVIGIGIGIGVTAAIEDNEKTYQVTVGVLQALTGGTLLYVAVFEILEREKAKVKVPGLVQFFCVVLGFSTMMMLEILIPHQHHDDGDDEEDHDGHDHRTLMVLKALD